MKKVLLSALCLIAAGHIYAFPVEGGEVLNHQEIVPPNVKLTFKESKASINMLKDMLASKSNSEYGEEVHVTNKFGEVTVGDATTMATVLRPDDNNLLLIVNGSSSKKTYTVTRSICIGDWVPSRDCIYIIDDIVVEPNQFYSSRKYPVFEAVLPAGKYAASISMVVESTDGAIKVNNVDFTMFTVSDSSK